MANYTLAPPPYQTVLDNAGNIVPNACIWTYVAGTTTPAATYSDALGTPNTNPIRADSAGRFTAYLQPGAGYLFVVEQPATPPAHGAVIRTQDNVVGVPAAAAVTSGTWLPSVGGSATYSQREGTWARVGPLVFARGALAITTLGTGLSFQIDGLPFPVAGRTPGAATNLTAATVAVVDYGVYADAGTTSLTTEAITGSGGTGSAGAGLLGNGTSIVVSITYLTAAP
jgi:hypothetical protein